MFHDLDPYVRTDLCAKAEAELLALADDLQASGQTLAQFQLRGKACGPLKLRLTARNDVAWGGPSAGSYGEPDLWSPTELMRRVPVTMSLIRSFPLATTGRILAIITPPGQITPDHTDHNGQDTLQEFVWVRLSPEKPFHLSKHGTQIALSQGTKAVWFDTRTSHGSGPAPKVTISLRVDGRFAPNIRTRLLGKADAAVSGPMPAGLVQ